MSQLALSMPVKAFSRAQIANKQWICHRCLTTQSIDATASSRSSSILTTRDAKPFPAYDPHLIRSKRYGSPKATNKPRYALTPKDWYLKSRLQQKIPDAYLQSTTSDLLPEEEKAQREKLTPHRRVVGVVVSTGKMDKTVKVRIESQTWNKRIGKYFASHENFLVHDHNSSLVVGDVIEMQRLRISKQVRHVVKCIVSPFGTVPIESRPPIPTPDQWLAAYKEKRTAKLERRNLRRRAADGSTEALSALQAMGLDSGNGAALGKIKATAETHQKASVGGKSKDLSASGLAGGLHEAGNMNDRAQHNKRKAMKGEAKAVENLAEAAQKETLLEERGVKTDSII